MILKKTHTIIVGCILFSITSCLCSKIYDNNDWIPITKPATSQEEEKQIVPRRAEGRVLNLHDPKDRPFFPESNIYRSKQNQQKEQYLTETLPPIAPPPIRQSQKSNHPYKYEEVVQHKPVSSQYESLAQNGRFPHNGRLPQQERSPKKDALSQSALQHERFPQSERLSQTERLPPPERLPQIQNAQQIYQLQEFLPPSSQPNQPRLEQQQHPRLEQPQYSDTIQGAILQPVLQFPNPQFSPQPQIINQQLLHQGGQAYFVPPQDYLQQQLLAQALLTPQNNLPIYPPNAISTQHYPLSANGTLLSSADILNQAQITTEHINRHNEQHKQAEQYKQTETSPPKNEKSENESVQLLYVPLESLQQKQGQNQQTIEVKTDQSTSNNLYNPTIAPRHYQFAQLAQQQINKPKQYQLSQSIENDFIQQALEAHRLQLQLKGAPVSSTAAPKRATPTIKKRKPHQPPLAVYMGADGPAKVADVLAVLKNAKSIAVQDTVGPNSPQVFVGPNNLEAPEGYAKFELPYLSSIDSNRVERKVDQLPFFVAPLSYKAPTGYAKIPLPSPHVGSVVINQKVAHDKQASASRPTTVQYNLSHEDTKEYKNVNQQRPLHHSTVVSTPRPTSVTKTNPYSQTINHYELEQINSQFLPQNKFQYQEAYAQLPQFDTIPQSQPTYSTGRFSSTTPSSIPRKQIRLSPTPQAYTTPKPVEYKQRERTKENAPPTASSNSPTKYSILEEFPTDSKSPPKYQELYLTSEEAKQYKELNLEPGRTYEFIEIPATQVSSTPVYDQRYQTSAEVKSNENVYKQEANKPQEQTYKQQEQIYQQPDKTYKVQPSYTQEQPPYKQELPSYKQEQSAYNQEQPSSQIKEVILQRVTPKFTYHHGDEVVQSTRQEKVRSQENLRVNPHPTESILVTSNKYKPYEIEAEATLPTQPIVEHHINQPEYVSMQPQKQHQQLLTQNLMDQKILRDHIRQQEQHTPKETIKTVAHETPKRGSSHFVQQNDDVYSQQQYLIETTSAKEAPANIRSRHQFTSEKKAQHLPQQYHIESTPVIDQQHLKSVQPQYVHVSTGTPNNGGEEVESYSVSPHMQSVSPVLPSLINNLQDQSLRPLLIPAQLAPTTENTARHSQQYEVSPIQTISSTTHQPSPSPIYHSSITPSYSTTPVPPTTTTRSRLRGRQRGGSRYSVSSTTASSRRVTTPRTRRTTTTRPRYNQDQEKVVAVDDTYYNNDAPKEQVSNIRSRFRTRGRIVKNEITERSGSAEVTEKPSFREPQLLGGFQVSAEAPQQNAYVPYTTEQDDAAVVTAAPQFNKQVYYIDEKYQDLYSHPSVSSTPKYLVNQNEDTYPSSQKPETIRVSSTYEPTIISDPTREQQYVRFSANVEPNSPAPQRASPITTTDPTSVRIKSRARVRTRPTTTTQRTTTTQAYKEDTKEESEEEFYGFFRQPNFKKVSTPAPSQIGVDGNLYEREPLYSAPVSSTLQPISRSSNLPTVQSEGVQIYTSDGQVSSTRVQFLGEIRPKYQASSTPRVQAVSTESVTPVSYYTVRTTKVPTTEAQKARTKGRIRVPGRRLTTETSAERSYTPNQSSNELPYRIESSAAKARTQRLRTRGKVHFQSPQRKKESSEDDDVEGGNYPPGYVRGQPLQTQRPSNFQITVDPGISEQEEDDQLPYSSIYRPKILPNPSQENSSTAGYDVNNIPVNMKEYFPDRRSSTSTESIEESENNSHENYSNDNDLNDSSSEETVSTQNFNEIEVVTEEYVRETNVFSGDVIKETEEATKTTPLEETTVKRLKGRRRGLWKKIKKPVDNFETAESQNIGTVYVNSFSSEEKVPSSLKDKWAESSLTDENTSLESQVNPEETVMTTIKPDISLAVGEGKDFFHAIYEMFGLSEENVQNPESLTNTAGSVNTEATEGSDGYNATLDGSQGSIIKGSDNVHGSENAYVPKNSYDSEKSPDNYVGQNVHPRLPHLYLETTTKFISEKFGKNDNSSEPLNETSNIPKFSKIPDSLNIPEQSDIPEFANVPELTNIPESQNIQESPDVPDPSNIPEFSNTPTSELKHSEDMQFSDSTESITEPHFTVHPEFGPWNMGVIKTSTSTEISHETEICYKGRCIKSTDENPPSL